MPDCAPAANNDEYNPMSAHQVLQFVSNVCLLLKRLEVDGWRNKKDFMELEPYYVELAREAPERAIMVSDRVRLCTLIGGLDDDCRRTNFFKT